MTQPLRRPNVQSSRWQQSVRSFVLWVQAHPDRFWAGAGTLVLVGLAAFFLIQHRQSQSAAAWTELWNAQGRLVQNDLAEAMKALDAWDQRFQGRDAGTYAKFLRADLLYKTSDYAQAAQVYGDLAVQGRPEPVRPLALAAQVSATEMAGNPAAALALSQSFMSQYPDHFLAAPTLLAQARLTESAGKPAEAAALYDRYKTLYPQSPWAALAQSRLQALGGPAPAK